MEAPALADERAPAHAHGCRCSRCAGRVPAGRYREEGDRRRRFSGVRRWHVRLARGHHDTEVRRHRQRRQRRDARMLLAVPRMHRQRHTHVRGRAAARRVRGDDGWEGGTAGPRPHHRRVQPALLPCDTHGGAHSARTPDRRGQGAPEIMLRVLPRSGTCEWTGDDRVLLHIHGGLRIPPERGRGDRGGHGEGLPRRSRRHEGGIRCLHRR